MARKKEKKTHILSPKRKKYVRGEVKFSRKPTKAEKIAAKSIESISSLTGEEGRKELINMVRTLRAGYTRRVGAFKRRGLVSYAQLWVEENKPKVSKPLNKMSRNRLILEFAVYQKFFTDVTSTVEGIKRVNFEQDLRIFGADDKGLPTRTMTADERMEYWSLYDEFKHQNPAANYIFTSERVQSVLASMQVNSKFRELTLAEKIAALKERLGVMEEAAAGEEEEPPNVYSGQGPNY